MTRVEKKIPINSNQLGSSHKSFMTDLLKFFFVPLVVYVFVVEMKTSKIMKDKALKQQECC